MTDLIPRDAAITVAKSLFRLHTTGLYGAAGVPQYGLLTETAETAIRAIPTIDPAAIREAALALSQECPWRDDTSSYREWHEDRRAIATRLLALIGEKK